MSNVRQKLIDKIKQDTGFEINNDWAFFRPSLSWVHRSAGRQIWYFLHEGKCIGSNEKMTELLKSDKIILDDSMFGFITFHSS